MKVSIADVKSKNPKVSPLINKYMRLEHLPQIWCPGCGNGIVMRDVVQAIENLGLSRTDTIIVSGIGCSSRAAGYMDFNTIHTTHGRAIAFATGIKLANPRLNVIVIAGDGDISAIGGNHLIHAARRNIGLTVVVMNNSTYGMTGGQYSTTTPTGALGTTAPYGNLERPFDIANLAFGAGASYAARGSAYHVQQTISLIQEGIRHKGFSIIDVATTCPTYYGRENGAGDAVGMLKWQKENSVTVEQAARMKPEELKDKLVIGLLRQAEYKEFTFAQEELIRRLYLEREANEEK
ncbi:MAG: thiamine pyrophosphate-dependent enzyme [Firmicutes bacterium]|nr:thiamine pyrophosphate-dependent enzyme [Bacillota bacterium]